MNPLPQLLDDLRRQLAAGAAAAGGLRRSAQALRALAAQAPALVPLAELAGRAAGGGPAALCELLLALAPARAALAAAGCDGELAPAGTSGPWATATPADHLYRIIGALNRTLPDRRAVLGAAVRNGRAADMRLVEPLLRCLRPANSEITDLAADQALPAFGPAVLPDLLRSLRLKGQSADGRRLRALCRIDPGQGGDWCRRALAEGNAFLRVQALKCLPLVAPAAEVVQTAREWLARPRGARRRAAVEVLEGLGAAAALALPELLAALAEGNYSLAEAAARALAAVGGPAVRPLTDALRGANPGLRRRAAVSLRRLGQRAKAAVPALIEALDDRAEQVRGEAMMALVAIAPEARRTVAALITRLREHGRGSRDVRLRAAALLERLGPPPAAVPALLEALRDHDPGVRGHVAMALSSYEPHNASAVPALVRALRQDSNYYVRGTAAEILERMGRRARPAVSALMAALQDPVRSVRSSAAAALGPVGARAEVAVPVLAGLLRDPEDGCRLAALRALAQFGRRARAAIPALTEYLATETNGYIRGQAEATLAALRGQSTSGA
jgi:HEAT repeat protein